MAEKEKGNLIIPGWAVEGFKLAIPAFVAILMAYVQIQSLETRYTFQEKEIRSLHESQIKQDEILAKFETSLSVLLEKHNNLEKNINSNLNLLSDMLKELRTDVKNLPRHSQLQPQEKK